MSRFGRPDSSLNRGKWNSIIIAANASRSSRREKRVRLSVPFIAGLCHPVCHQRPSEIRHLRTKPIILALEITC